MGNEVRLIDAKFAQHIANKELNSDESGVVQWVLSHTPTIDPESLRPKGRWIMTAYTTTSKRRRVIANKKFACSECGYSNGRKRSNYCSNCGTKMEG